jgi:hypothetical protein
MNKTNCVIQTKMHKTISVISSGITLQAWWSREISPNAAARQEIPDL